MNIKIISHILFILVLASCGRHESSYNADDTDTSQDTSADKTILTLSSPRGFCPPGNGGTEGGYKTIDRVGASSPRGGWVGAYTPIKDQGHSDLCWIYAMLATIETDRLAMGDSVNLSPLWLQRKSLEEQADNAFFANTPVSLRGTLPEAMRLMQTYGMLAWDAYHQNTPPYSRIIARKVMQLAKTCYGQKRPLSFFRSKLADLLESDLGPAPRYVFMLGAEYTPLEFTHSLCLPGEWKAYTSFTHHPFNKPFAIEIPDNRQHHEAMNVPIHILYNKVVNSLRNHHPVAWEGCMKNGEWKMENGKWRTDSGDGKFKNGKFDEGYLIKNKNSIQNTRQRLFERHILTDDHCMAIIGMRHASNGETVFICKNSWGIQDGKHGLRYMTARQFMLSTIMIMTKEDSKDSVITKQRLSNHTTKTE